MDQIDGGDEIIHQSLRLRIMASLNAVREGEQIEFTRLKAMLAATDGNLGSHLTILEKAGYVAVEKVFVGKKPRTLILMTAKGRGAFARHVGFLKGVLGS